MAEWATAADALRRRQVKKMTNKELSAELAKVRKRLNRRMRELERTGYYKYSGSYTRLENYIRSDLGGYRNVLGQWEFTTKPYAKATRRAREELLIRWQHFQDYQGLTSEEVKQSLEEEAKKLNEMTESNNYNIEKVKNIRDMMAEWREDLDITHGSADWKTIIPALRDAGYDGYLVGEVFKADADMSYADYYKKVAGEIGEICGY